LSIVAGSRRRGDPPSVNGAVVALVGSFVDDPPPTNLDLSIGLASPLAKAVHQSQVSAPPD
jgi:hypothetical protein